MAKDCSRSGDSSSGKSIERAEGAVTAATRSVEMVMKVADEIKKELAKIEKCEQQCYEDGTVEITLSSGQTRRFPCPLMRTYDGCWFAGYVTEGLEKHIRLVMASAGVPLRHIENFRRYHTRTEPELAKLWAASGFLIIGGGYGTGKSFCAACAVFEYLKRQVRDPLDRISWESADRAGRSVMWGAAMEIADDRDAAERAKKASLAVIDGLGCESGSPASLASLRGVIERRYDMKLPAIVTTSLTMPDIAFRYGSGMAERLTEDMKGGGRIIDCGSALIRNMLG